jgi:hypothetical protein
LSGSSRIPIMLKKGIVLLVLIIASSSLASCSTEKYTFADYQVKMNEICKKELEVLKKDTDKTITSAKKYASALASSFRVYSDLSKQFAEVPTPTGFTTSHENLIAGLDLSAKEVKPFLDGIKEEDGSVATLIDFISKSSPQEDLSFTGVMKDEEFDDCIKLAKYQDSVGLNQPIDKDLFGEVKDKDPIETATKVCEILRQQITAALEEDTVKSDNGEFERFSLLLLTAQGKLSQIKPDVDIIGAWNKFVGQYGQLAFSLSKYANLVSNEADTTVIEAAKKEIIATSSTFSTYASELGVSC